MAGRCMISSSSEKPLLAPSFLSRMNVFLSPSGSMRMQVTRTRSAFMAVIYCRNNASSIVEAGLFGCCTGDSVRKFSMCKRCLQRSACACRPRPRSQLSKRVLPFGECCLRPTCCSACCRTYCRSWPSSSRWYIFSRCRSALSTDNPRLPSPLKMSFRSAL